LKSSQIKQHQQTRRLSYGKHYRGHLFQSSIDSFFQKLNISDPLSRSSFYKEAGFSCTQILKELFALVFTGKNLYRALLAEGSELSFKKIPLTVFSTADILIGRNSCIWS